MQAEPQVQSEPAPAKLKKHHKIIKRTFYVVGALLFIGLVAYSGTAYVKNRDLNQQVSNYEGKVSDLESKNQKLTGENKKLKSAVKPATAKAATKTPAPEKTVSAMSAAQLPQPDGNFVALTPHGGFMNHENLTTFEFTPHKDANKYVVEMKMMGQQSYPTTSPADQTVVFATGATQPQRIKVTKNVDNGDYQWRVTAISTIGGTDKVLQSTEDRNYQIR